MSLFLYISSFPLVEFIYPEKSPPKAPEVNPSLLKAFSSNIISSLSAFLFSSIRARNTLTAAATYSGPFILPSILSDEEPVFKTSVIFPERDKSLGLK